MFFVYLPRIQIIIFFYEQVIFILFSHHVFNLIILLPYHPVFGTQKSIPVTITKNKNENIIYNFRINVLLLTIALVVGLLVLARVIYLKPAKLKYMHRKFRKIPKWFLKTVGIMYLVLCFVGMVCVTIFTYKYLGI